jgi:hypothetical protein
MIFWPAEALSLDLGPFDGVPPLFSKQIDRQQRLAVNRLKSN